MKTIKESVDEWESKQRGLTVADYQKYQARIDKELSECHCQAHLHGEEDPTPYEYVANELFWAGYFAGREFGINMMIDGFGIREDWDRISAEVERQQEKERWEDIKRRVLAAQKE